MPPANDDYANATSLGSATSGTVIGQTTSGATAEVGEYTAGEGTTVWYKWTAPVGPAAVRFVVPQPSSGTPAPLPGTNRFAVKIFADTGNTLSDLLVDGFDRAAGTEIVSGTTYYIQVDSLALGFTAFTLLWVTYTTPPPNDDFASAANLGSAPQVDIRTAYNVGATTEASEPVPSNGPGDGPWRSVWWKWRCPSGATFADVSTALSQSLYSGDDALDTVLAVYTGTTLAGLVEVASNDDAGGVTSSLSFTPTPGTTYYVQVSTFDASIYGPIRLSIDSDGTAAQWHVGGPHW